MNCLNNLIGIHRSCSTTTPTSNLYIQDLPGISLKVADAAIDSETISGLKLIEEKIEFAQSAIINHIRNQVASKVRIKSVLENQTAGFYNKNLKVVNAEQGKLKGVVVEIGRNPYLEFYISQIRLKLSNSITTKIYIYDLMNNVKLDEFDITTEANVPTAISVNKGYSGSGQRLKLMICIDAGVANTFETSVGSLGCSSCSNNSYVKITGSSILENAQKISDNVKSNTGTNGLSIDYALNCTPEPFICKSGNLFAWALLHKTGAELMNELLASRRLNSIILIDKETNEELRDKYEAEYMASMSGVLQNLVLPDNICFNCNPTVRKTVAVP